MEVIPYLEIIQKFKESANLTNVLLDFTLNCLLDQPNEVIPYAKHHFEILEKKHTPIEYSIRVDTLKEQLSEEESIVADNRIKYVRRRAKVVYSEPYNPESDDDDDLEDIVYEKTEEQKTMLLEVVKKCLLFRSLDSEQVNRVIDAMFPQEVEEGDYVIKQYDDGDNFYIIEHGLYDVFIASSPTSEPRHVFTYINSGTFGELSLMYNMPRAASIRAVNKGRLWALDRHTFRRVVLRSAFRKRKMYEALIAKVPILQQLTPYERMNVADALLPKIYNEGDIIMSEGDDADGMYFIEKGAVKCFTIYEEEEVILKTLESGDYFGELALITHQPRAATVKALEYCVVAFLDKEAFERVLGPCVEIMQRNISVYQKRRSIAIGLED